MATQEVSVVDAAANKRRFVIVKRDDMTDKKPVAKQALRLPAEAKTGIMDGLAQSLDKLTALATMVGEAESDDAAAVPPDLGLALRQCSELISGLADQYAPAEVAPPEQTAPAEMAAPPAPGPDAEKAATPPAGTEPAAKNAPVAKDLPPAQRDGDNMTPQRDGDKLDPPQMKSALWAAYEATASAHKMLSDDITETLKAGRKIAGGRYKKLSELHDSLGKLLNELAYDDAMEDSAGKGPPAKKNESPAAVAKSADFEALVQLTKRNAADIAAQGARVAKMERTPAESRVRELGGGAAPSKVQWPADLSADLAARRKTAGAVKG